MRTDAILINSKDNNELQKRMDRLGANGNEASPGFAMQGDQCKSTSFQNVYNKVAQSNVLAKEKTDNSVQFKKTSVSEDVLQLLSDFMSPKQMQVFEEQNSEVTQTEQLIEFTENSELQMELLAQMQLISGELLEKNNTGSAEDFSAQATAVIVDAVKKISDALQINLTPEIENFSLDNISSDTIGKFAEIISVLKGITGMLETAIENGESLDTGRTVLNLESVKETADILRNGLFKIQLGLNMVGIGENVAREVSEIMEQPHFNGINQAVNPENLSMPLEQIKRIFGYLGDGKESGTVEIDTQATAEDVQVGKFDAQTYRTLLKIEKKEKVSSENIESVNKLENIEIPVNAETVIASDPADLAQDADIMSVMEVTGKNSSSSENINMEPKLSRFLTRTTEQSVVNQLTEKIHHIASSGDTEIRIQLRPESLGDVKLAIRMEGDIVVARIQVENQQVKQIVENNLQSLKDALAEQNLQAGSFDVNVGQGWGRQPEQFSQTWKNQGNFTDKDSDESEVVESVRKAPSRNDTGNRYGNNSIEYYA